MSPLEVPEIDSRRYCELVEELITRIPIHTPEWTEHGEADPGITLLELLVFMGESLEYRLNEIPEAGSLSFLDVVRQRLQAKLDCLNEEEERIRRALDGLDALAANPAESRSRGE